MTDLFGIQRKKKEKEQKETKKTGIFIEQMPAADRRNYHLKNVLLNGTLNAMIVLSSIISMLEAFEVDYYGWILCLIVMLFCYFTAAFYVHVVWKILGYIAIISGFIFGMMELRQTVRGGFGTIANAFMEVIEVQLDLPIERRYEEFNGNRAYAVTLCGIFIGGSFALLFNIVITEVKGYILVLFFTFPIVQLGLYFDRKINLFSFAVYFAGMTALMLLRSSPYYKNETKRNHGYKRKRKKETYIYDYVMDSRNSFSRMARITGILVLCIGIVSVLISEYDYRMNTKLDNSWKQGTESFAKQVSLVGFWGMLNPNGSGTGGIGRSKLGQADHIEMDYQKDLDVLTAVVPQEDTIYLRSYAGTTYEDNSWKYISERQPEGYKRLQAYQLQPGDVQSLNYEILMCDKEEHLSDYKKMLITYNSFANNAFYYIPNTAAVGKYLNYQRYDDEWPGGLSYGNGQTIEYYHLKNIRLSKLEQIAEQVKDMELENEDDSFKEYRKDVYDREERYREYVKNTYLSVPEKNREVIEKIFKRENISNQGGIDSVYQVISYLEDNYEYTLMPGVTPSGKDFVNYFLEENPKGYCTYFASAAVLMFRQLGIPARYIGGYAASTTDDDYRHPELSNNPYTEGIYVEHNGKNLDYPIYDIEVNDSQAHAWTEVYVNHLGWVTVEVTPPSDEEETEETDGGIGQLLANVFDSNTVQRVKDTALGTLLAVGIVFMLFVLVIFFWIISLKIYRKKNTDIENNYRYLVKIVKAAGLSWKPVNLFIELAEELEEADVCHKADGEQFVRILEKKRYSRNIITEDEREQFHQIVLKIRDCLYENLPFWKKVKFLIFAL